MIREDCGKETKMESDAALEWIAQQYQGGCKQVAEPRGGCTHVVEPPLAEDQQGLCEQDGYERTNSMEYIRRHFYENVMCYIQKLVWYTQNPTCPPKFPCYHI